MSNQITQRLTATQSAAVYAQAVEEITEAFAKIAAAERTLTLTFCGSDWGSIQVHGRHRRPLNFADPDESLKELDKQVWGSLVQRLELKRMMSVKAYEKLQAQIDEGAMPPINERTILQVFEGFASNLDTMLKDAVTEVYDWLRPWRTTHKTNEKNARWELGPKIIITGAVESAFGGPGFRLSHWKSQSFTALENVFNALDGKGSISKSYQGAFGDALKEAGGSGVGETEHFGFRCFGNGNMHLTFKRADLLAKFNALAGGKNLKGGNPCTSR